MANISDVIYDRAKSLGLDWTATGGGMDYISKELGGGVEAWLVSVEGSGSPDRLRERALVVLMLNRDHTKQIVIPYKTAEEGMVAMKAMYMEKVG